MKKQDIINLIKYHSDKNDSGFRSQAASIANEFYATGDEALADYIMSLISTTDVFVPQIINSEIELKYCAKESTNSPSIFLPKVINDDIIGIINAISYNACVNRFLFSGAPGTGKTETVKQIARMLNRELYSVNFNLLVDSKLGQTAKNIAEMFDEINHLNNPERIVILLDEIDSLAMNRVESNDIREMGRATSEFMRNLEKLNSSIALFATTNLIENFDSALLRRFDSIVDFNRYSENDLIELSEKILDDYLNHFSHAKKDMRLFRKIIKEFNNIPYPGDMTNLIRTVLAFSDRNNPYDYLKRLYIQICSNEPSVIDLKNKGYTVREIEKITGIPKSSVSRKYSLI